MSLKNIGIVGFTNKKKNSIKTPLDLVFCTKCSLLQLKQTIRADLLWNAEYGYRSGINDTMRKVLLDITKKAENIVKLRKNDIVIDIGCNDGTLLDNYTKKNIHCVGYDPSHNVISVAHNLLQKSRRDNFTLFVNFFSKDPYLNKFTNKAKIITAIAMFYDLDNPNIFLQHINTCLDKNGLFIIQQNYLPGMLKQNAFDNIVHEHLEYYSLTSLINLLKRHHLEVFDATQNKINGGSFRTYIRKKGSSLSTKGGINRVRKMLDKEVRGNISDKATYLNFTRRINKIGVGLKNFLKTEVSKGKIIYLYGASTRGNTLLNYFKINNKLITAAAERNPYKWGKITAGTNIPIVSEEKARNEKPDYFLVLPWFFRKEFIQREDEYLKKGGKFIFPLPEFEIFEY